MPSRRNRHACLQEEPKMSPKLMETVTEIEGICRKMKSWSAPTPIENGLFLFMISENLFIAVLLAKLQCGSDMEARELLRWIDDTIVAFPEPAITSALSYLRTSLGKVYGL